MILIFIYSKNFFFLKNYSKYSQFNGAKQEIVNVLAAYFKEYIENNNLNVSNKTRFYFLNIILHALEKVYSYNITKYTHLDEKHKAERLTVLKRTISFIGTDGDIPDILNDFLKKRVQPKNLVDVVRNKLGCKDTKLIKNMSEAFNRGGREEKSQIVSFFYQTDYTFKEISSSFQNNNVKFCGDKKFRKVMDQISKEERKVGQLNKETREKFLIKKKELVKCIYNFCEAKSEPSPDKTYTLKNGGQKIPRQIIKMYQNKTDLWDAFCKGMRESFSEVENDVFSDLSQESKRKIQKYREEYRETLERINLPNPGDKDKGKNICCQKSFNSIMNLRELRRFMFAKRKTDCCTVCEDCYSCMTKYKKLDSLEENLKTTEVRNEMEELKKIIYAGVFHKEQNENCKKYANSLKENLKEGEAFIVMDFKGKYLNY